MRAFLLLGATLIIGVFAITQLVSAFREKEIYVFPTEVQGEGWEHIDGVFSQELSAQAEYQDFQNELSAHLHIGSTSPSQSEFVPQIHTTETSTTTGEETQQGSLPPESAPAPQGEVPALQLEGGIPSSTEESVPQQSLENFFEIPRAEAQEEEEPLPPLRSEEISHTRCVILGSPCHTMHLTKFSLGGVLSESELGRVDLSFSLGSEVHDGGIFVASYKVGNQWKVAGEVALQGTQSNRTNGGYLTFSLPDILDWQAIDDLEVLVEFIQQDSTYSAQVFLDAAWLTVRYEPTLEEDVIALENVHSELLSSDTDGGGVEEMTQIFGKDVVQFHTATSSFSDGLHIQTDRTVLIGLSKARVYTSITNTSGQDILPELSLYEDSGAITLEHAALWAKNIPVTKVIPTYGITGYFCASGWLISSSTQERYQCMETGEERNCSATNVEMTNCIVDDDRVGENEETTYISGWKEVPVREFQDPPVLTGLFGGLKAIEALPVGAKGRSTIKFDRILEANQTVYVALDFAFSENTAGSYSVLASGDTAASGVTHLKWDGAWKARLPISITNSSSRGVLSPVLSLHIDESHDDFWTEVREDGGDIRLVDGTTGEEIPFGFLRWSKERRVADLLTRIGRVNTLATSTVYVYFGNAFAERADKLSDVLTTESLEAKGTLLGDDSRSVSVDVTPFYPSTHLRLGEEEVESLDRGSVHTFENVHSGDILRATGPLSAIVSSGNSSHVLVPHSQAGYVFTIPDQPDPRKIYFRGISEEGTLTVTFPEDLGTSTTVLPISVSGPVQSITLPAGNVLLESTVPMVLSLESPKTQRGIILSPAGKSFVGQGGEKILIGTIADQSSYHIRCSSGGGELRDGRLGGKTYTSNACGGGTLETGDIYVVDGALESISLTTYDTDGSILRSGISALKGNETILPYRSAAITIGCFPGDSLSWEIISEAQEILHIGNCESNLTKPEKVTILAGEKHFFPEGTSIRTSGINANPLIVFSEFSHSDKEMALPEIHGLGDILEFRGYSGELSQAIGDSEYVFPQKPTQEERDKEGKEIDHINDLLSLSRDFGPKEFPLFRFKYQSQKSALLDGVRSALGLPKFHVETFRLIHQNFGEIPADIEIIEVHGDEWTVQIRGKGELIRPGKYTLQMEMNDNGDLVHDAFDFYWGMLALNTDQTEYAPESDVQIFAGAISDAGNTLCDAVLKLQISRPDGKNDDLDLPPSGFCSGNNVTAVPDYFATYHAGVPGTYALHLVSLDADGKLLNEFHDAFSVSTDTPYVIARTGPTRIYPLALYPMKIRVTAKADFSGALVEKIPKNFVVVDRGGAVLEDEGEYLSATWQVGLMAGETQEFTYVFDAPNLSPYRFTLGPSSLMEDTEAQFTELREWQIASDAAGQMLLYWDSGTNIPTGWTCISCNPGDPLYQRFPVGSSLYGTTTGTSTHTHSATGTVAQASGGNSENSTVAPLNVAPLDHSHIYTPVIAATTSLPRYRTLRVIRSNAAGDPAAIPTDAIALFDVASSSLPTDWYRYDAQDGYFAYGENTVGTIAGSSTHTHDISSSTDKSTGSGLRSRTGGTQVTSAQVAHQHIINATTTLQNHEPSYVEVLFAKLSATGTPPNTMIAMWNDTPPEGWLTLSNSGQAFDQKFFKASTTYGGTGGSLNHTPLDVTATSSTSTNNTNARVGATGASATSTHQVTITFGDVDNNPSSLEVIIAKRLVGVSSYTQEDYRFYVNTNANTPTDPWPSGGNDLAENEAGADVTTSIRPTQVLRLRMNMKVGNATATAGSQDWKLQYTDSSDCASALNWTDVAPMSSSTALWRGYNNSGVTNNATIPSVLLSTSTITESYVEENNATTTPVEIPIGGIGEWDWVVQDNTAIANTTYCFRMVKSNGTLLDEYVNYPNILTNQTPDTPEQSAPFDNEAVATTSPWFEFLSTDPEGNALDFQIQVDDDPNFGSPELDYNSIANPELFDNVPNPSNKSPFNTGDTIRYRTHVPLTASTTYWWRVRAIDPGGSNAYGSWSLSRSVTIDLSVTVARWYQSTDAQFRTDTLYGTQATSSVNNFVTLISGSTTGTTTSSEISFTESATGTAWGSISWNDNEPAGSITYRVEYFTSTGTWALIPNTALSGNSTGFTVSPISLVTVDPSTYDTIRIVGDFIGAGGSGPRLLDWTVNWAFVVNTPTLYKLFDNEKTNTTTPSFEFSTTDPQGDSLTYEFQWSTSPTFTSSTTRSSNTHSGFQNLTTPADTDPFNSGDRLRFTIQAGDALTASTTYYWRVRARDPLGANTYSFYSDVRSLTVDLSVNVPTWFQTMEGQFDTDSLTSAETSATRDMVEVSTSTTEAMVVYGEGTTQTPRYRIWDGLAWGAESSALTIDAQVKWVTLRSSPIGGEYLLGTEGSDGDTIVQIYSGGAWGNKSEISNNLSNSDARGIGVAWETLSGEAMAVSCDGDTLPSYSTWSGTNWTTPAPVANLGATTSCEWIRLASDPASDEIILLERNTGSKYYAAVWDGSSWGSTTSLGQMVETNNEGMAVEYEDSGNQAIIVTSSGGTSLAFQYNFWNGASWAFATSGGQNLGDHPEFMNLRRDAGTDNMALCYIDNDNDIGTIRWNGASWVQPTTEHDTGGNTKAGRAVDCVFENTSGRDGYIMVPYSDTTNARYQNWNGAAWLGAEGTISTIQDSYIAQAVRTASNTVMAMFFDDVNTQYDFSYWTGTTWSTLQTLETNPSDTTAPFRETFMMEAKVPTTRGTIISSTIDFDDGVAPAWDTVYWSATTTGSSTIAIQVQYLTASGTWDLIPDVDLPGNSVGDTSTATPISLINLNTTTYNQIRLKATLTCILGNCPTLNDWTVRWAEGIDLSGTAKQFDLTSNVTSGTVAVAVNGTIQTGKTGTISAGVWSIDNVTVFPGNTVTVFIDGANDENEAVTVSKYSGPGDFGGLKLFERHLTIGSASTSATTTTNTDISAYDNSISSDEDIFYNVDAGNDLTVCAITGCGGAGFVINSGTYRPDSSSSGNIDTYDLRIDGTLIADGNTISVAGSWDNNSLFAADTGTVLFTATSGTRTIDSTGAATSTFNTVTFGSGSGTATWTLSSALSASGDVSVNFGTLSQSTQALSLSGNLTFGVSGVFQKGTGTTTFAGSVTKIWTDNTTAKQDLGNVLIDGSSKTLQLGSNVKATNLTIGGNDTLDVVSTYTTTVLGYWANGNVFNARTGTVSFQGTSTPLTINPGTSPFHHLEFRGGGGSWSFTGANATTTGDVTVATGTVTLPTNVFSVGGSWTTSSTGNFLTGGNTVKFTSSASGKTITGGTSTWSHLTFSGSGGGWTFGDTHATTTGTLTITAGTVTLPAGTLSVKESFDNTSGAFLANQSSVLKLNAATSSYTVRGNGSSFGTLLFSGGGSWTMPDTNATTTGSLQIVSGTTTLPAGTLAIGGSFTNSDKFTHASGTLRFLATSTGNAITSGDSLFGNVDINNSTGGWTITGNATTSGNFSLTNAATFTQTSGTTLEVRGTFQNFVGGASTTWSGSRLWLNSGTNYTVNSKTLGGDAYGIFTTGGNTQVRLWNSTSSVYVMASTGSLYSQDHNAIDGELYIFGNYLRTTGTDYWSYATDFDGTVLSGVARRQVSVKFASSATSSFLGSSLEIVGDSTASTTITNQGAGIYDIVFTTGTIYADRYQFRNLGAQGLQLLATTTITSLANGDFELAVAGGTLITMASTTVDRNQSLQISAVRFATTTAITGFNVTELGTATSSIRFIGHYGNLGGESFDNDPGGNPGNIRWDDSSYVISISGTVYQDAGVTPLGAPTCDSVTSVVRVKVQGGGTYAAPCSSGTATGTYTVSGVTFTGDLVFTVYLDTGGGPRGAIVTKSATGDLTGMNLYQNRVIVRHEDVTPITIANMNAWDSLDDGDIPFTVSTSGTHTLAVNTDTEFWIWNSKTFIPGGNITINYGGSGNSYDGKFHLDNAAVFTAQGTESHSVGGSWQADSGSTFTAASSTWTFTATSSGRLITAVPAVTFYHVVWNGSGGAWSISGSYTVEGNFTMTAGTLSGSANITIEGGAVTGNGDVQMSGGTFTVENTSNFSGDTDWIFMNLTFGNGSTTATTTKIGTSAVLIAGVLTISTSTILEAGDSLWILIGAGTPIDVPGTLDPQMSTFQYGTTTNMNVRALRYFNLDLSPLDEGTPTYTFLPGVFTIEEGLSIGDGTSPVIVTANTNDPAITIFGDIQISQSGTFIGSDSGWLGVGGSWENNGTFTHSSGLVTFTSTSTGRTISASTSPFGSVTFDNSSGGWTITTNATSSGTWAISQASAFTLSSGATLEVDGTFTNLVGGASTTWTGSVLHLNSGTTYTINTKTQGDDEYAIMRIGTATDVKMWNSSAGTTTVLGTGSLYSQDHGGIDGDLYIWGDYTRSSGNEYWSYATDFDGTSLGGSSRQVDVRLASSSSATLTGGTWEILGTSTASTTIDRQSSPGAYALRVSGGTLNAQYYSIQHPDGRGLDLTGSPTITDLSRGEYEVAQGGGSGITVSASVIDANPLKIFFRNRFATTTTISAYNVTATGSSTSAWRFNLHTPSTTPEGNLGGEFYDNDPGGDPGMLIWDDSAANISISGVVYSDSGTTPIGSPVCDNFTPNVRLRVQGGGSYTATCDSTTGVYTILNVIFNPGDTLTVFLDTGGGARGVTVSVDPATNVSNMDIYRNTVIVRHEGLDGLTLVDMDQYDFNNDPDIPFITTLGAPNTLSVFSGTELRVWTGKGFTPNGNVTVFANASTTESRDGSVIIESGATFQASGSETHTFGGRFTVSGTGAYSAANSTVVLNATTTSKIISPNNSSFYNLSFTGNDGSWSLGAIATSSNDVVISGGAVTLPTSLFAVGGSFTKSGTASFDAGGNTVKFYSITTGKTIQAGTSTWADLLFAGVGGGWTIQDTNGTTTRSITIATGTVVLPSGTLAVTGNFDNTGGVFSQNQSATLKMIATSSTSTIVRMNGSSIGNLLFGGGATWTMSDTNATTTGSLRIISGTTTLPTGILEVRGSFVNSDKFTHASGTLKMTSTTTGNSLTAGNSLFGNVEFANSTGGWTITGNATTSGTFTLRTASSFTQTSGTTLEVRGAFTNLVGGVSTTWTGTRLTILNGSVDYTINTKTQGGDLYNILRVGSGTQLRAWNSSGSTYEIDTNASLYSQDHAGIDGDLYIFGTYSRIIGTDYWSYATDFDGTALGGSSRAVTVRYASGATSTFSNASLEIVGGASATTTITNQGSGVYQISLTNTTLNSTYYAFRNLGINGLQLLGTTTIQSMQYGDFELAVSGGSLITIASTTIDQNASSFISRVRFATTTAITGYNVTRSGTSSAAITFQTHYGNLGSETFDDDGGDGCGQIRFDDSSCLFVDQSHYRWRNDDGGEGVPSSEWYSGSFAKRRRVTITHSGGSAVTNAAVKFDLPYDADMQSDFDDVRFTDSTGTTSLSYWFEEVNASATSTVWVKVPTFAIGENVLYVYYGNGTAASEGSGTSTFTFFDDFEDGNISEYSGDTSLFSNSTVFNYERTRGVGASSGNEGSQTTDGIGQASLGITRNTTFRFFQYIDLSAGPSDEPCTIFGAQSPFTSNQNYAVCLEPFGTDHVGIYQNVSSNSRGGTELSRKNVTYTTGWYETQIDWLSTNTIDVRVYSDGSLFATTSTTTSTYTSGGIGLSFWGQRGGWDLYHAYPYLEASPATVVGPEQVDSGATWKALLDTVLSDQPLNQNVRLRVQVENTGGPITNQNFRLQIADKASSPNCESVPTGNYTDVPTTSSGCGSAAACIVSSSQFIDHASTTDLLSAPTGATFTPGELLEDPSQETTIQNLNTDIYTEIEYAFQMTSYAVGSSYCLRTTDSGTPLDNYSHVAEVSILHAPSLSNYSFNQDQSIALIEGATTTVYATGTATDLNGYTDLRFATSTYYRSGLTQACTADSNNCYQIASTSCAFSNCSGNSCTFSCQADLQYFADPTDIGSPYAGETWQAFSDVVDFSGARATASATQELLTVRGFDASSTIGYGSITVGQDSGSFNPTTTVRNTGNVILNLLVSGTDMTNGASNIPVQNQKYGTSSFTYSSCPSCTALATTSQPLSLNLAKPTTTTPVTSLLYWGINIPLNTAATTHTGANTLLAN